MNETEKQATVPYFIHEGQMARMERITRRLTVTIVAVLLVTLIMFVINNVIWLRYVKEVSNARVYEQSDPGDHL